VSLPSVLEGKNQTHQKTTTALVLEIMIPQGDIGIIFNNGEHRYFNSCNLWVGHLDIRCTDKKKRYSELHIPFVPNVDFQHVSGFESIFSYGSINTWLGNGQIEISDVNLRANLCRALWNFEFNGLRKVY